MSRDSEVGAVPDAPGFNAGIRKEASFAERALEKADATALYNLWQQGVADRTTLMRTIMVLMEQYADKATVPNAFAQQHGESAAIAAIREVAKDAIGLAMAIVNRTKPDTP